MTASEKPPKGCLPIFSGFVSLIGAARVAAPFALFSDAAMAGWASFPGRLNSSGDCTRGSLPLTAMSFDRAVDAALAAGWPSEEASMTGVTSVEHYLRALSRACAEAADEPRARPLLFQAVAGAAGSVASGCGCRALGGRREIFSTGKNR